VSAAPWKFSFTYSDLADVARMRVIDVKRARRRGEFDPSDFLSVLVWLRRRWGAPERTP
jgi:hypothetical protein